MNTDAERLLEALGGVWEVWIEDAAPERMVRRRSWRRWIALAACLAVVAAAAYSGTRLAEAWNWAALVQNFRPLAALEAIPSGTPAPAPTPVPTLNGLPLLTIRESGDMGMGFEGIMVRDVSELDTGSPWTPEAEVSALPVYRNTAYTDYMPVAPDGGAAMLALAEETAAALGTEITQVTYERVGEHAFGTTLPDSAVDGLEAETPPAEIRVDPSGSVGIFFEPYAALPDGSETSSREAAERVTDLLL